MTNVKIFTCNVYATNNNGDNFRAVSVGDGNGNSYWQLCKENRKRPGDQDFVNTLQYTSGIQAITDCDNY